jgi:hypothetical protein
MSINRNFIKFLIAFMFVLSLMAGCVSDPPVSPTPSAQEAEQLTLEEGQQLLVKNQPAPVMDYSLERDNIKERLTRFNDPNKISYLTLMLPMGQLYAYYAIKGKVSSVNSYMTTSEQIICKGGRFGTSDSGGSDYQCFPIEAPDSDGSYGTNGEAIFFFTVDGVYKEWNGLYELSDEPSTFSVAPIVVTEETE